MYNTRMHMLIFSLDPLFPDWPPFLRVLAHTWLG